MKPDLTRLHYFVAVAEEQHLTRAAERLGIQQPPLSVQMKALQRELDTQLFRRKGRGLELTEAGRVLLDHSRVVLASLDRAIDATRRTARGEHGCLSLGIAPTAPFHPFVPRSIRAFREAHPDVTLAMEEGLSNEVRQKLVQGLMDAAFVRVSAAPEETLSVTQLLEERMIAALPRTHPLASKRSGSRLDLARLADEDFVLIGPSGTGIHDDTQRACHAAGFTPRVVQIAPRITSTLGLIAAGMGIALVPESLRGVRVDGVVYRELRGGEAKAVLALAHRRHDPSPVLARFTRFVRSAAQRYRTPSD